MTVRERLIYDSYVAEADQLIAELQEDAPHLDAASLFALLTIAAIKMRALAPRTTDGDWIDQVLEDVLVIAERLHSPMLLAPMPSLPC